LGPGTARILGDTPLALTGYTHELILIPTRNPRQPACVALLREGVMHIHSAAIGPISTYAAVNQRAAAAQRAAEVRKRLLKAAQTAISDASSEEILLVGRWLDSSPGQAPQAGACRPPGGDDPDFA
jgi:hypothetical protein